MPETFTDAMGRKWSIAITYGLCRRIKREFHERGIDLLEPLLPPGADPKIVAPSRAEGTVFSLLQTDVVLFYDVLEAVLRPQLDASGVSPDGEEGFGNAMAGEQLFAAQEAFFREWLDFFRTLHRDEIATAMEKMMAWWGKAVAMVKTKIESEEIEKAAERKLSEVTSSACGKLLESLDSTPPTEP